MAKGIIVLVRACIFMLIKINKIHLFNSFSKFILDELATNDS
jgi:hypothetical protein